jgi:hypothetical protein
MDAERAAWGREINALREKLAAAERERDEAREAAARAHTSMLADETIHAASAVLLAWDDASHPRHADILAWSVAHVGAFSRLRDVTQARRSGLAASQAEAAALRAGLEAVKGLLTDGDGDLLPGSSHADDAIDALLASTPHTDALREFGVRVAEAAICDEAERYAANDEEMDVALVALGNRAAAIVARVLALPDAGQPEKETK